MAWMIGSVPFFYVLCLIRVPVALCTCNQFPCTQDEGQAEVLEVAGQQGGNQASTPHVISHRGASGYVPEHSLEAYRLASNLHSHYIELDLALTRDGVFVAMHDLLLDSTTDVAE